MKGRVRAADNVINDLKSSGEASVDSIKETLYKLKIRQEELDGEAKHYRDGIITKERMLKKMEDKKCSASLKLVMIILYCTRIQTK